MRKNILFLDGTMMPAAKSFLQSLAPGVLAGRGVFETMRVYRGRIFALDKHIRRLKSGLKTLKISQPYSPKKIKQLLRDTLDANQLKEARLRLTIWRIQGKAKLSIIATPYEPYSKTKYKKGFKALWSDKEINECSNYIGIKSIDYLSLLTERKKAKIKGCDEALFVDRKGFIAEGSHTNVFWIKEGVLFTPSLRCGCLNGITRRYILNIAKALKIKAIEKEAHPQQLIEADEAFVTNSLIEIMPLTVVSGHTIGVMGAGLLTKRFARRYRALVQQFLTES